MDRRLEFRIEIKTAVKTSPAKPLNQDALIGKADDAKSAKTLLKRRIQLLAVKNKPAGKNRAKAVAAYLNRLPGSVDALGGSRAINRPILPEIVRPCGGGPNGRADNRRGDQRGHHSAPGRTHVKGRRGPPLRQCRFPREHHASLAIGGNSLASRVRPFGVTRTWDTTFSDPSERVTVVVLCSRKPFASLS